MTTHLITRTQALCARVSSVTGIVNSMTRRFLHLRQNEATLFDYKNQNL